MPTTSSGLFLLLLFVALTAACGGDAPASAPYSGPPVAYKETDLVAGTGPEAVVGARLTVNYTGWLYDPTKPDNKGQQFDSSIGREPFTFKLGAGEVIPGWDVGFSKMRVRGKRRLVIPSQLAYGAQGTPGGPIPPNAPLVFEMELLDVR